MSKRGKLLQEFAKQGEEKPPAGAQRRSYIPAQVVTLTVLIMHITTGSAGINFQIVFHDLYKFIQVFSVKAEIEDFSILSLLANTVNTIFKNQCPFPIFVVIFQWCSKQGIVSKPSK